MMDGARVFPAGGLHRQISGGFGVIAPLPADCFTLDEVTYVCTSENRENKDEINTVKKEKRRAIEFDARGFPNGPLLGYHNRCRLER